MKEVGDSRSKNMWFNTDDSQEGGDINHSLCSLSDVQEGEFKFDGMEKSWERSKAKSSGRSCSNSMLGKQMVNSGFFDKAIEHVKGKRGHISKVIFNCQFDKESSDFSERSFSSTFLGTKVSCSLPFVSPLLVSAGVSEGDGKRKAKRVKSKKFSYLNGHVLKPLIRPKKNSGGKDLVGEDVLMDPIGPTSASLLTFS